LAEIDENRPDLSFAVREQVSISIKYEGYIKRQMQQVEQFKKLEERKLDKDINYDEIKGLRLEARQKLNKIKPESVGQASRISGVSPADISVLLVYLEQRKRQNHKNRGVFSMDEKELKLRKLLIEGASGFGVNLDDEQIDKFLHIKMC